MKTAHRGFALGVLLFVVTPLVFVGVWPRIAHGGVTAENLRAAKFLWGLSGALLELLAIVLMSWWRKNFSRWASFFALLLCVPAGLLAVLFLLWGLP